MSSGPLLSHIWGQPPISSRQREIGSETLTGNQVAQVKLEISDHSESVQKSTRWNWSLNSKNSSPHKCKGRLELAVFFFSRASTGTRRSQIATTAKQT